MTTILYIAPVTHHEHSKDDAPCTFVGHSRNPIPRKKIKLDPKAHKHGPVHVFSREEITAYCALQA